MSVLSRHPDQLTLQDDHRELLEREESREMKRRAEKAHRMLRLQFRENLDFLDEPTQPPSSLVYRKLPCRCLTPKRENRHKALEIISFEKHDIRRHLNRGGERVRKASTLIDQGETSHARRLLTCRKKSVECECPENFGGCGEEHYHPIHCNSRLCETCYNRMVGRYITQFKGVVGGWSDPAHITLTIKNVDDPVRGKEKLQEAFAKLRRRVIPTGGDGWVWRKHRRGESAKYHWKQLLQQRGHHDLVRRLQKRYVDEDRGIPFTEVVSGGIYGVDIKEKQGEYNVHAHVLADVPFIPQNALSAVWEDLTGAPVVDVRRVEDDEGALAEVIGYALKPPEFHDVEREVMVVGELKGQCLVQCFGSLYGEKPAVSMRPKCPHCGRRPAVWFWGEFVDMEPDPITDDEDGKDPPGG